MVVAGLVPATPKRMARCLLIEMAGTSPAMTSESVKLKGICSRIWGRPPVHSEVLDLRS
jgi:hypothetical protein